MRKIIVICILAFGISLASNAQETALTSKGKVVILYDNGTWKYADVKVANETAIQSTNQKVLTSISNTNEAINLVDAEPEKSTFIEGPSAKLKKYFKEKNIVRCDFAISSKDGKAFLKTNWKIMTGEAYSYFGFIKKGNTIRLELLGGETVDLTYTEEFEPKEFERYGFSTYSAELEISKEQLKKLRNRIVMKAHMTWSKRTEEYQVANPSFFIKTIPQITK